MATISTGFQPEAKGLAPVALPGRLNYHHDINADHSSGAATLKRHMELTLAAANALNARRQMVDRTITETANLLQIEKAVDNRSAQPALTRGGDTFAPVYHINIEGNADENTVQQFREALAETENRAVARSRVAAQEDRVAAAGRQRIGSIN